MIPNEVLQKNVLDAIKWDPLLNAFQIGVIAKDGVITLTGIVDSYAKKIEAEDTAKKVDGVNAIIEEIEIQFGNTCKKNDSQLANELVNAFKWRWEIPDNNVRVNVKEGWVTLEGELQWNYQKDAARSSAINLPGVKGITDFIKIRTESQDEIKEKEIEYALARNWLIDHKKIQVMVNGSKVRLTGTVHSIQQRDEAIRITRNSPGIRSLENELVIEYDD
jgi:osmotically-inducible protein OsmY